LDRLVKGLLDISRLESGYLKARMEWCDVEDIVGVALGSFKSELKGRKILVDIETNLPLIFVDFVLIEQAIKNLIGNALTHTDSDAAIEVRGFKTKEHVVIQVLDEGPGIAQESLPHLFDKFYRDPKARPGGVGLGLSIAKGFVEAHSGDLLASNRQPKGANFIIRLPLKTQPTVHNEIDKESVE